MRRSRLNLWDNKSQQTHTHKTSANFAHFTLEISYFFVLHLTALTWAGLKLCAHQNVATSKSELDWRLWGCLLKLLLTLLSSLTFLLVLIVANSVTDISS